MSHMLLLMLTFQLGLKTAANLYWAARVACGWHICCSFGMHGRNFPKKSPILFKKHKKTAFCNGGKTRKIKENKKLLAKQCFQMEMSIFWEVLKRHHRTHVLCPIDSSLVLIEHGYKATQINCTALIRAHISMFILSSHIICFPPLDLCDEKEHNSNLYLLKIFPIHHMLHMQYLHILPSSTKLCLKVSDLQFYWFSCASWLVVMWCIWSSAVKRLIASKIKVFVYIDLCVCVCVCVCMCVCVCCVYLLCI